MVKRYVAKAIFLIFISFSLSCTQEQRFYSGADGIGDSSASFNLPISPFANSKYLVSFDGTSIPAGTELSAIYDAPCLATRQKSGSKDFFLDGFALDTKTEAGAKTTQKSSVLKLTKAFKVSMLREAAGNDLCLIGLGNSQTMKVMAAEPVAFHRAVEIDAAGPFFNSELGSQRAYDYEDR